MSDQLDLSLAERDRILAKHQSKALVRWLSYELYRWGSWVEKNGDGNFAPVSANDARKILEQHGIVVEEKRIFGGLFGPKRWVQCGWTKVDGPGHKRRIGTFRPKPEAVFEPVEKPDV